MDLSLLLDLQNNASLVDYNVSQLTKALLSIAVREYEDPREGPRHDAGGFGSVQRAGG